MKAGFGRRDITPHRSMNMAGFDRRKDPSTGTLDELEVQVLALADDREVPFLMCIFDLLGTDSTLCTQVRESISVHLEIPPERIWVGATHTHSAPTGHFSGNASYNKDYVNHLATQAVAAAAEALADLKPAAATGAMAQATGNPRFAWDCYRRFVQMYGDVVMGVQKAENEDMEPFESVIHALKQERYGQDISDSEMTAEDNQELVMP
jgi:hypothetical protein